MGVTWMVCDRRTPHGQHDFVSTGPGPRRGYRCPGVTSTMRPGPRPTWRERLGVTRAVDVPAGRHRAEGAASTMAASIRFKPRHCGGDGCLHDHAGASVALPPMSTWARPRAEASR